MRLSKEAVYGLAALSVAAAGALIAVFAQAKPAANAGGAATGPSPISPTPVGPNDVWQLLAGHEYLVTQYAAIRHARDGTHGAGLL